MHDGPGRSTEETGRGTKAALPGRPGDSCSTAEKETIRMYELCPDCGKHLEIGDWPFGCAGLGHTPGPFFTGDAQVHTSEKTYVDVHPLTGDQKIPGRVDRPMNAKLAAAGYERKELTMADVRKLEKQGKVSEKLNYNSNGSAERALGAD